MSSPPVLPFFSRPPGHLGHGRGEAPKSVKDFAFAYQGKQISQITAFIWRWIEEKPEGKNATKVDAAQRLRKDYFLQNLTSDFSEGNRYLPASNLVKLFAADPRYWIKDLCRSPDYFLAEEARLLECVFGEERITQNPEVYLSPLFSHMELGVREMNNELTRDNEVYAMYEFVIDPNTFNGHVSDPFIAGSHKFRYFIPFPPIPTFGENTVTKEQLEDWTKDGNNRHVFPTGSLYIPVTT